MIGRVTSTKMNNTVTVLVERVAMHPLYKKTYLQSKKYLVDAPMELKDGDVVEIIKVKPISKNKHWRAVKVIGSNLAEITKEQLKAKAEEVIAEVMPEEKEELENPKEQTELEIVSKKGGSKEVKSQKSKVKSSSKK